MAQANEEDRQAIREAIRKICAGFPDSYWRDIDKAGEYPQAFVDALTASGYLGALIPEEYGGAGLGITEAGIILEEINRSAGNALACHAQMYTMGTLLKHGSEEQKRKYLPKIAGGELRLQAFGVTEPNAGSETTKIETRAVRQGDKYIVNGQKIFISRVKQSDLMLLLARTTPYAELKDKTKGLSVFLVDLRDIKGKLDVKPLDMMINHHTNILFFEDVEVPAENLIGQEGMGFRHIIDGWNAERILIASEAIGDGRWFVERAAKYASERVVFGRPDRRQSGRAVSHRARVCPCRGRRPHALLCRRKIRSRREMRRRSQHGQAARVGRRLGSGECLPRYAWRLWLCPRIRCGAQIPRDAALHDRADQQQSGVGISRPERAGHATILLSRFY